MERGIAEFLSKREIDVECLSSRLHDVEMYTLPTRRVHSCPDFFPSRYRILVAIKWSMAEIQTAGGVLRVRQVEELVGLCERTLRRLEERGEFPRRRRIGPRAVGWLRREVERWIQKRPVA